MDSSHLAQTSDSTVNTKEALYSALQIGKFEEAAAMLQNHPELINCELKGCNFSGTTLLLACDCERYRITQEDFFGVVRFLPDQGADPNCVGCKARTTNIFPVGKIGCRKYDSVTPLMVVAFDVEYPEYVIKLLLNAGAKIDQINSLGQTALHMSCIRGKNIKTELLHSNGVDVNLQDVHDITALHYACENTRIGEINLLCEAGAQLNIVDSSGFTELELAAQSVCDPLQKLQKLLGSYDYPVEAIIEAYETAAWSLLQQMDSHGEKELGPAVDCMRKATLLRMEQNIPKKVSDPLECYGFTKEWETMEELSRFENSSEEIMQQAMLSRERIFRERHRSGTLLQYTSYHRMLAVTKQQLNALLIHSLYLYEESLAMKNLEGYLLLMNIGFVLATWFSAILSNDYQSQLDFEDVDTERITKTVEAMTGACVKMKLLLEKENQVTFLRELFDSLSDCVLILTGIIMKLYKRKRSIPGIHVTEESLAKQMLREVISKIDNVVSHAINFQRPVQHIIIKNHIKNHQREEKFDANLFKDNDIYKVLLDCINNIDATDGEGNTLLLLVAQQFHEDKSPNTLNTLDFLIGQGAYTYAKNSERKTVLDYLSYRPSALESRTLEMLRSKIPSLQTLAASRAKDMHVPLTGDIPDIIKIFIKLH